MQFNAARETEARRPDVLEYDAAASERLVREFPNIVGTLWGGFGDLQKVRNHVAVFKDLLVPIGRALGAKTVFLARLATRSKEDGIPKGFDMLHWCPIPRTGNEPRHARTPKDFRASFQSHVLSKAMSACKGIVCYGERSFLSFEKGPLSCWLSNLGVTRLWFESEIWLLGVSLRRKKEKYAETWSPTEVALLEYFPELIASPLRIENERVERQLFERICSIGNPVAVADVGTRILRQRIPLAWHARSVGVAQIVRPAPPSDLPPPTLSGDYDRVFAYFLDAKRFLCGSSIRYELDTASPDENQESWSDLGRFASLINPKSEKGHFRVQICEVRKDENWVHVSEEAVLSQYAAVRSLIWIAYKCGVLGGTRAVAVQCPLAKVVHTSCDGTNYLCEDLWASIIARQPVGRPKFTGPSGPHASWLRCLWLEVHYRARQMMDHQGQDTDKFLAALAKKYKHAAEQTAKYLPQALEALQKQAETAGETRIDWRWLYLWFLTQAFASNKLNDKFGRYDKRYAAIDAWTNHYYRASVSALLGLHLLHFWKASTVPELWDVPELRLHELAQARIHLLCEYAYSEIGVDRNWRLEHHLLAQCQPEMTLYAASPSHRDHVFHVIDVCLLGHLLLTAQSEGGGPSTLGRAVLRKTSPSGTRKRLRYWYSAALLHDTGYALALAKRLPSLLSRFKTADLNAYRQELDRGASAAHQKLDESIAKQFKELHFDFAEPACGISFDHGAVTVNHLIHLLRQGNDGDRFVRKEETRAVLGAILKHNRAEETLCASEWLAFLLMLCDHLQEWGRARIRPEHMAIVFLSSFQAGNAVSVESQYTVDHLVPNARYDAKRNALVFRPGKVVFRLQYSRSHLRMMEPACQWVGLYADFQRVWCDRAFPDIELELVHPQSDLLRQAAWPVSEMQLMRDYAATEEGAFLANWLADLDRTIGNRNGEMHYEVSKDRSEERFILRLGRRRRRSTRYLPAIPSDFYVRFLQWKSRKLRLTPDEG